MSSGFLAPPDTAAPVLRRHTPAGVLVFPHGVVLMQRVLRSVSDLVTGLVYVADRFPVRPPNSRELASGCLRGGKIGGVAGSTCSVLTRRVAPCVSPSCVRLCSEDTARELNPDGMEDEAVVVADGGLPRSAPDSMETNQMQAMLLSLPDELLSCCCEGMEVSSLIAMESTCRRLREQVSTDSLAWRQAVRTKWGKAYNNEILDASAVIAGGWKKLFAEKYEPERRQAAFVSPTRSEVAAILNVIKGQGPTLPRVKSAPGTPPSPPYGTSPVSVSIPMSTEEEGRGPLSIVCCVDGSSSVTEEDFWAMKDFLRSLVCSLCETHPTTLFSLLQFNQTVKRELPALIPVGPAAKVAVQTMKQLMGSTDIEKPLATAASILASAEENGSQGGDKVILLLSDGQTHMEELAKSEAQVRKAAETTGARFYALGVGRDVDEDGLRRVAAGTLLPARSHLQPMQQGAYFTLRRHRARR